MEERVEKLEKMVRFLIGRQLRLEKKLEQTDVSDSAIYGALWGIDFDVLEILDRDIISRDKVEAMIEVINPIFIDKEKLKNFKGYYDIEPQLKDRGIERHEAKVILTYFKADDRFLELIEKMDSQHSPTECRNFDVII